MVRKRSYKKYIQEESDSDDFYEEEVPESAQPKKYSLRQRRGTNFAEDFDYDLVEEADGNLAASASKLRSDDEEFETADTDHETSDCEPRTSRPSSKSTPKKKQDTASTTNCTITTYKDRELEPEIPKDKQSSEDMIDFEDVIRADILVNKSRIDYDTIIEKTEIKIQKTEPGKAEKEQKPKRVEKVLKEKKTGGPPKKRGRKPKQRLELEPEPEESYDYESPNAGLPINTVLGVTESLYELAERYHMQGGIIPEQMEPIPPDTILKDGLEIEMTEGSCMENDSNTNVLVKEPETVSEAIESF
ncbi:hypothetical protein HHI36_018910 [Cryptolaemus montrouzieri]|uniref:Uncharacterized protein n=1 Tax=Cryptolaemus montrouzieri TaxID=559131 RepID=A0ABD2P1P5_9CUCU